MNQSELEAKEWNANQTRGNIQEIRGREKRGLHTTSVGFA